MKLRIASLCLCLVGISAWGETLQIPDDAPTWMHLGAFVLLMLHIGGGTVGIATGAIASTVKKGQKHHRWSGRVFFASMGVTYVIGAAVAPFLANGQRPNFVGGILALYLLISGVSAARRRQFTASVTEGLGLCAALFVTAMGAWFAYQASQDPSGTVDGSPPQAFAIFLIAGSAALIGEIRVLAIRELSNVARQRRHLWRMCTSFFIASGSLFFGQPQVFPEWFNDSLLPALLSFAPLAVMIYWLFALGRRERQRAADQSSPVPTR